MNPRFIFLILVILIIVVAVVYVLYFMPKSDETRVLGPFVLKGVPSRKTANGSTLQSVLTQAQLTKSLKSNFTMGFFFWIGLVVALPLAWRMQGKTSVAMIQ